MPANARNDSVFAYDVFLSHSSKDKDIVRAVAERLKADGIRVWFDEWEIKPGDNIPAKIEDGLERSRILVFCMSANAFSSDWTQLESYTFRFRDPLNKDRRFIPLRFDDAPIKGSLAQFLYINWQADDREQAYAKLLEACRAHPRRMAAIACAANLRLTETSIQLNCKDAGILSYALGLDEKRAVTGGGGNTVRVWDLATGLCLRELRGHTAWTGTVQWSKDQRFVLSGSRDRTVRLWEVESSQCLRILKGHTKGVLCVAWCVDERRVLSGSDDSTVRLWDLESSKCVRVLEGHAGGVFHVAWGSDQHSALTGGWDGTVRLWDLKSGRCVRIMEGHSAAVHFVVSSADGRRALSAAWDGSVRLWDVGTGQCLRVLEGHLGGVFDVAWSADERYVLSASNDETVRLWDVAKGRCMRVLEGHNVAVRMVCWSADGRRAVSGDAWGGIRIWDLSEYVTTSRAKRASLGRAQLAPDQVQYTNAKVLLVGDTSSGKTGLAHRLATGKWKPSDGSTVGAWSTQWPLSRVSRQRNQEQEIWLWDFGGQADQRLIHQLYMDRAALILLLFDADQEDVLPGLRDWQAALRRCMSADTRQFLVAGRIDAGFKASRAKLQSFADENRFEYFETSAQEGDGCDELRRAIKKAIPWAQMEKRTSPRIFKLIKDQILMLRDEGRVLHTFKELHEELCRRLPEEPRFSDETLQTVIGLLDGPGAVKELDYGSYILLQPEWINIYAQAVIRTLRQDDSELGCLPLSSIAEGRLLFQTRTPDGGTAETKRLPENAERVVLREMERQLEERGLCLRQGDKLVFPSHCGRDRPAIVEFPSVFVSYAVKGYLDDIYATLVVKLADSDSFKLNELWRDAADFATLKGDHHMGVKLTRDAADTGSISVYFAPGVSKQEQVIFANYIDSHLQARSESARRLRHYVCPHCNTPKGNSRVLMEKLIEKKAEASVICDKCDKPFGLWDDLEILFASPEVRRHVEGLRADDAIRLDARRKGKLLVLEVGARLTSADQKFVEIPGGDDEGIDIDVEFTDAGVGTARHIYLQLKSGNSHLVRRADGTEVFPIKKQSWVKYWLKHRDPVMLVIGTFAQDEGRFAGREKVEFAEIRWMEIRSYLKRESEDGTKPVRQIVFQGERLDMDAIQRRRREALAQTR